jgi:hypothetical protein
MARPRIADGGDGLQIWRILANILNKKSQTTDKGWSSSLVLGKGQTTPHCKKKKMNSVFGLEKVDRWNIIRTSAMQSRPRPMRFLGFSNHEKGAPGQEISK